MDRQLGTLAIKPVERAKRVVVAKRVAMLPLSPLELFF
jgi:hypothetical protein